MTLEIRNSSLEPALILLYDPEEKYSPKALERARYAPRVLVGGSKSVDASDVEEMVDLLTKRYKVPHEKIMLFPGHEKQVTPKVSGVFLPACIPNSTNPDNLGPRQERAMPLLKKLYGNRIELAWYLPHGGSAFEAAECRKITPSEEVELFEKWTDSDKFHWFYQEAGSGQEMLPLQLIKKCKRICEKKGRNFIYGGGIRRFEQAKNLLKAGINYIVMSNVQLEPWGYRVVKKIQTRLYTARDIYFAYLLSHRQFLV